ncbi:MAG: hypothetical protein KGL95_15735, partial [Patescibacteria group bacterium]|nr:hypothetical protein [Patescibacteria group bacterium]
MSILTNRIDKLVGRLAGGVMEQLKTDDQYAFLDDKVSNVQRTRVASEFCSTLVRLDSLKRG